MPVMGGGTHVPGGNPPWNPKGPCCGVAPAMEPRPAVMLVMMLARACRSELPRGVPCGVRGVRGVRGGDVGGVWGLRARGGGSKGGGTAAALGLRGFCLEGATRPAEGPRLAPPADGRLLGTLLLGGIGPGGEGRGLRRDGRRKLLGEAYKF